MTTPCPNGHASEETDYCSVCGVAMAASASPPAPDPRAPTTSPPAPAGGEACPTCATPRADPTARFCEVCRYDFDARAPGPAPVAAPDPAPAPASPALAAGTWQVVVVVDPTLDVEPDPAEPAPTDAGERIFPIDLAEMLIGRRDDLHDIRPEIPVRDPAVSRRHAKLIKASDGGLIVLDLASANGTAVNGVELVAGERHSLADGDAITLGRWTRVTVRRAPGP